MLSHRNVVAAARQVQHALGLTARDVVLAVAPFFHVMGFVVTGVAPLAAGATVVTLPRFDLAAALAAIERHGVTVLAVPPPVMAALARHPLVDRHDLRSLELIVSGGAPLGAELQRGGRGALPARRGRAGLRADRDGGDDLRAEPDRGHRARLGRAADGRDRRPDRG